jgi:hypothetical protein
VASVVVHLSRFEHGHHAWLHHGSSGSSGRGSSHLLMLLLLKLRGVWIMCK